MYKLLFIFIFLTINNSFADRLSGVIELLETNKIFIDPIRSCDVDSAENNIYTKCAEDLCGDAKKIKNVIVTSKEIKKFYQDSEIEKDFLKYEKGLYQNFIKELNNKYNELIHFQKLLPTVSINDLNFEGDSSKVSNILNNKIQIEKNGSDYIISYDNEFYKQYEAEHQNLLNSYLDHVRKRLKSDTEFRFRQGLIPFSELVKYEQANLNNLYEKIKELTLPKSEESNRTKSLQAIKEVTQLLSQEKIITDNSLSNLKNYLQNEIQIQKFSAFSYLYRSSESYACLKKDLCNKFLKDNFNNVNYKEILKESIKQVKDMKANAHEIVKTCKNLWYERKIFELNKTTEKKFKSQIPKFLKWFDQKVLSSFSEDSRKKLNKFINNTYISNSDINFTLTDEVKNAWDEYDIEYLKRYSEVEMELKDYKNDKISIEDLVSISRNEHMGEIFIETELASCQFADVMWKADDSYGGNKVHFSAFSAENPLFGEQILYHELGHLINSHSSMLSFSSKNDLKIIRKCVSDQSINAKKVYLSESIYTEEDLADVFSFQMTEFDDQMLFCSTLVDSEGYRNIEVLNANDSHSAAFIRTLREAIYKNRVLSSSCRQAINETSHLYKYDKCEFSR